MLRAILLSACLGAGSSLPAYPFVANFLPDFPEQFLQNVAATTNGPTVAPQFSASLRFEMADPSMPLPNASGAIVYDAKLQKYWMSTIASIPKFGAGARMNQTTVASGTGATSSGLSVMDGQCMNFTGQFAQGGYLGLFGWLSMASNTGQDTVDGKVCDKWALKVKQYYLAVCLHEDEPLYLIRSTQKIYFANFQRSADPSKLHIPEECKQQPKPCGSGKIVKKRIYVAHPEHNYNITGQDVADAKGDAVFLCTDKSMWTIGNYKLLSAFDLTIVDTYSQYTNFPPPGTRGFGGDGYHVGRESALGIGRHGGQCDDDADWLEKLGSWYSLPRGGQCSNWNHQLGVNCTWRIERRVNTIQMDCLLNQQSLLKKCAKTQAPFEDVTSVLLKSLSSEDTTQGGCPSVKAPQCKMHPACAHLNGDCCPHQDGTMLDCCSNSSTTDFAPIVV